MTPRGTTVSQQGKGGGSPRAVYLNVGIWHDRATGHIHIASTDKRFRHSTVNDTPGSIRYHPNLYMKLKAVLQAEGRWP